MSRTAVVALFVVALTSLEGRAQSHQGTIRGGVRDVSGQIAGAEVRLLNEETAAENAATTNVAGEYVFASLPPGLYTVRASFTGFKVAEARHIRVEAAGVTGIDLVLDVGDVRESIVVLGGSPVIDRASASWTATIGRAEVQSLPNPGRNPFVLAATTPAVMPTGNPQFVRMQDQNASAMLSIAGGPRRGNNVLLDGVPIVDLFNRAVFLPSIDAVEEVRILSSTYDAESGRTAGGVLNITLRSGANVFHGSGMYAQRPRWGTGTQFFSRQTGQLKPETFFQSWSAAAGGPLSKNRTFWWASSEGYRSRTSQSQVLTLPTARERAGDFSGSPAIIYDPATTRPDPNRAGQFVRDPFPGNIIPPNRINSVARALLAPLPLPLPSAGRSLPGTARPEDFTNQVIAKVDHRLTEPRRVSAMYAWYHSDEPGFDYYGGTVPGALGASSQPRTVHLAGGNFVTTLGDWTTVAIRYGFMQFGDDNRLDATNVQDLGFETTYAGRLSGYPSISVEGYAPLSAGGFKSESTHDAHSLNASWTRLVGRHALRAGGEYRHIGMRVSGSSSGDQNGAFVFTPALTRGPNPSAALNGDAIASLLLGYPASGTFSIATPNRFQTNYIGGYVQDDFRLGSAVTVNVGARYEFEQGLHEQNNAMTVGFDRQRALPVQVPGLALKGGLMYAGVDGYPTQQGKSTGSLMPRAGVTWMVGTRNVIRAGYGLFVAPPQVAQALTPAALGTRGFTGTTTYVASDDGGLTPCATCTLTNPFPRGVESPAGATRGVMTGVGGDIDFVDQSGGPSRTHRYSVDLQRELPGRIALSAGYVGSRSSNIALGGTVDASININQLDPSYLALGSELLRATANPFFGNSAFGALATSPTVPQGQLLRPFPQFGQVRAHRATIARSRYDALVLGGERRLEGWGARLNYVYSVFKDNQGAEGNAFTNNVQAAIDNFDTEREYGFSVRDAPHRVNFSGTWQLPFGAGRKWLASRGPLAAVVGGWSLSAIAFYQSGFPTALIQAANPAAPFGFGQRPNRVPGVEALMPGGGDYDATCTCVRWLNPAAWTAAAPFTLGDAPHADETARTPTRANVDLSIERAITLNRSKVILRADVINLFDQTAFFGPVISFGNPMFGQIRRDGGFPRMLQLMARVTW